MKHELKIYPNYFYSVAIGAKKAELRSTEDRTFYAGDYVFLRECENGIYTGNSLWVQITDVADVTQFVGKRMALLSFVLVAEGPDII